MTSIKIAIASALVLGALVAGGTQVQQHAAPAHISALATPNVEICCGDPVFGVEDFAGHQAG